MKHDKGTPEERYFQKFNIGDIVVLKANPELKLSVCEYEPDGTGYLFVNYVSKAGVIETKRVHQDQLEPTT